MYNWLNLIFNEYVMMTISSSLLLFLIYLIASFMLKNTPKIIFLNKHKYDDLSLLEREQKELAENFLFKEEEIKEYTDMRQLGATQQQSLKLLHLIGKSKEEYKKKLEEQYKNIKK